MRGVSTGMCAATGIGLAVDGILLGVGFAAGERQGVLLTVALTLELLSLGLALGASLVAARMPGPRAIGTVAGLALLLPLGAVGGWSAVAGAGAHLLAGVLAFGAAALLYLVTEELLVEAHEVPETPFSTALFFAGVLALFLLELAGG